MEKGRALAAALSRNCPERQSEKRLRLIRLEEPPHVSMRGLEAGEVIIIMEKKPFTCVTFSVIVAWSEMQFKKTCEKILPGRRIHHHCHSEASISIFHVCSSTSNAPRKIDDHLEKRKWMAFISSIHSYICFLIFHFLPEKSRQLSQLSAFTHFFVCFILFEYTAHTLLRK